MKEQIKRLIGNLLIIVLPKKAVGLEKKGLTIPISNFTLTERLMRNAILNKAENNNNFKKLSKIHTNFWVSQGKDFFSTSNSFTNNFLPNCTFIFDIVKDYFLKNEVQFDTFVEIGTGNGDVLHYLESNFPTVDKFIGIDLSKEQIRINKEKYKENLRLEFINSEVYQWVKKEGRKNMIFMTSNGVFEYFTEHQLRKFIKYTKSLDQVYFVIIEPTVLNQNFEENPKSIIYGWEKSFSHNYIKIFQDYGFKIYHQSKKIIHDNGCEMNYIFAGKGN